MSRYPINVEDELFELERLSGEPIDGKVREMLTLFISGQNSAYQQGLTDGFVGTFPASREFAAISAENPGADSAKDELGMLVDEIRTLILDEFEAQGFSAILKNLGPVPKELNWGQKIYIMVQQAYIQGFLLAFSTEELNNDGRERSPSSVDVA